MSSLVTFLENTEGYRRDLRRVEYGDERDPEMRAFLERIAPIAHADEIRKPLFIIQGKNDPRVPASEALQMAETLRGNARPRLVPDGRRRGPRIRQEEERRVPVLRHRPVHAGSILLGADGAKQVRAVVRCAIAESAREQN